MAVLVTGSSGFIGAELVAVLQKRGESVIGLDRRAPGKGARPDIFVHADLMDHGPLESVLPLVDTVFHLAAAKDDWGLSEHEYYRDNVEATNRLLDAGRAAGVNRWVIFSTVGVLGSGATARGEESPYNPETPYAASKVEAEKLFRTFAHDRADARVAVIRPSAVFSPDNPTNNNIYRLIQAIKRRRFLMVGSGHEPKATSYLKNLIDATLFINDRLDRGFEAYNYVDDPPWSTRQLVNEIHALLGRRPPRLYIPTSFATATASVLDVAASVLHKDIPITGARIRKFCTATNFSSEKLSRLGFVPPVPMNQAVRESVLGQVAFAGEPSQDRDATANRGSDSGPETQRQTRAA